MTGLIIFGLVTGILWWALQSQLALGAGDHHAHQHSHQDDLTKIEGIGPQLSKLLVNNGIHSYSELGAAKLKRLEEIIDIGGKKFNLAEPDSWPKQAALAANGDWDKLKILQDELTGGR